jgi:hypothetical protein
MDEETLCNCLAHILRNSRVKYHKVIAANETDKIFYSDKWDSAYIINTARRDEWKPKIAHWYALYISRESGRNVAYLFCSYGKDPRKDYGLQLKLKRVIFNKISLQQSTSSVCGLYCLYYIYKKSIGYRSSAILSTFKKGFDKNNDTIIMNFYRNIKFLHPHMRKSKELNCCSRMENKI